MATTKLSTDSIDLSTNTVGLVIPSGVTGPDTTDTTADCDYPTTATALYQLQSNDDDTCGNYNGTGETNITYTSGKFGDSATFSGNGKIIIPSFPSFSSTGFTISLWIKTTDTLANAYILILNQVNYALFNINRNSGSAFSYYNGSWQTGSITVRDGNWHNIVVAISPNSPSALQVLYVDGVEDIRTTNSYGFTGSNSYNNIGTNNGTNPYTGQIAQLRIFPSVLTQADVTKLYNETNVTVTGGRPTSPTEGLLRDNTTTGALEFYDGSLWQQISGTLVPNSTLSTCNYPITATALYQFEDNANDTCNNYNGTAGANITYPTGNFGKAANFPGNLGTPADGIVLPSSLSTILNNNFSMSFWFNADTFATGCNSNCGNYPTLFAGFDNMKMYFCVYGSGSNYKLYYYNYGAGTPLSGTTNLSTSAWYNAVLTQSSTGGAKIYLQGNLDGSNASMTANGPATGTASGQNLFGGYNSSGNFDLPWNGLMDQIRIFPSVLTPTQVGLLYNES